MSTVVLLVVCFLLGKLVLSISVGVAISKDLLFQELLTLWGVDCRNWKQAVPKKKEVPSPVQATAESEASPSPASVTTSHGAGEEGKDRG